MASSWTWSRARSTRSSRATASSTSPTSTPRSWECGARSGRAAQGQPGPFSLGAPGVVEAALERAGFTDVEARRVAAPLRLPSTAEFVRFARESFGALHQMLAGLSDAEREEAWSEIERELSRYETAAGFEGPCELLVAAGTAPA